MVMPAKTDNANGRNIKPESPPCDPLFEHIDVYVLFNYFLFSYMLTRNIDPRIEVPYAERLVSSIWLTASFAMTGLLLDRRSFAVPLEFIRLIFMFGLSEVMFQGVFVKLAVLHCVVSFVWFAILNYHRKGTAADLKAKAT